MLTLQNRVEQDVAILDLEGPLIGGPETESVRSRVRELVREGRERILLNLAGVPWANSLGIGMLVASYATARRESAQLALCCPADRVEMILRAEKLIPVLFDPYRTEAEALAGFETTKPEDHPDPR